MESTGKFKGQRSIINNFLLQKKGRMIVDFITSPLFYCAISIQKIGNNHNISSLYIHFLIGCLACRTSTIRSTAPFQLLLFEFVEEIQRAVLLDGPL